MYFEAKLLRHIKQITRHVILDVIEELKTSNIDVLTQGKSHFTNVADQRLINKCSSGRTIDNYTSLTGYPSKKQRKLTSAPLLSSRTKHPAAHGL